MKGRITTADFYFVKSVRGKKINAEAVKGVVVVVRNDGRLARPEESRKRALRKLLKKRYDANEDKYEVGRYEVNGPDLGQTQYEI